MALSAMGLGQVNNGGNSTTSDWDLGTSGTPTSYMLHTKSWFIDPITNVPKLEETTVNWAGSNLNLTGWAYNTSGVEHNATQDLTAHYLFRFHWIRTDRPAPSFVYVTIRSYASASVTPLHASWGVDNGIGTTTKFLAEEEGIEANGAKTYKIAVAAGYAEKEVSLSATSEGVRQSNGSTYNAARVKAGAIAEIKGAKIVSEYTQTYRKGSNKQSVPNDETSLTDARIDTSMYLHGNSQYTNCYATFAGNFLAALEGTWMDPFHVWTTLLGFTQSDDLITELNSINDSVTTAVTSDLMTNGLTKTMNLSVRNMDTNDDVTIPFPLKVVMHLPVENPVVIDTIQDSHSEEVEIFHFGPPAVYGTDQIIDIRETSKMWDFFGWITIGTHVLGDYTHNIVVVALSLAVHYALEDFIKHDINGVAVNYIQAWPQAESTWNGSHVRPGGPNGGVLDTYKMNGGIVAWYDRQQICGDKYNAHGYYGDALSHAFVWHREYGYGNYFNGGTGSPGPGGQNPNG
jgi:hypothetical protein